MAKMSDTPQDRSADGVPEIEQERPVVIVAHVEQMIETTDRWEIPRTQWNAWTPQQRQAAIDDFGATTMNNCGGYGASIESGASDSDLQPETDAPITPAEQRTGVSDARASIADEITELRRLIHDGPARATRRAMRERLDRIAALVPQRAMDRADGAFYYLHDCGHVQPSGGTPTLCFACGFEGAEGWQALYTL